MAEYRLTPEGLRAREERLEYLKATARGEIAEQIKIARGFGDLSENAEYDAAKQEQARIEAEIVELETMLRNVVLIDEQSLDAEVVGVGSTVTVKKMPSGPQVTYRIVGTAESDPFQNRISNESPVGRALLGHAAGKTVEIHTPGGIAKYKIVKIGK